MLKQILKSNHLEYQQQQHHEQTTIITKYKFINPRICTEQGPIDARISNNRNQWSFSFKLEDIAQLDGVSTKVFIIDENQKYQLVASKFNRVANFNKIETVWYREEYLYYFRNTASRMGYLTLQKKIRLDHESEAYQQLIDTATTKYKNQQTADILIYEKESNRFEESGARLFERISEHPNVYYVIRKTSVDYPQLKQQYGDKIVSPDEERFLKLLFTAKYYIGTELPMHLIGVRSPYSKLRVEIMNSNRHKFIFLQHGVMYALSIKGENRAIFRKNYIYNPYKFVVSSKLEANHLIADGNYKSKDIWNIGLATFDNKRIDSDANKITIMLTWRPWDELNPNVFDTTYYQAVKSIIDNITDKSNLQLILHPKVANNIEQSDPLSRYLIDTSIDQALNQTKVLITDYSSVVFDAYYRGANVIFWWEQKDQCLAKYKNQLLLTEDNVFGDVASSSEQLDQLIADNYCEQHQCYIEKYRQIVEFHDDQNTTRLIECLQAEQII